MSASRPPESAAPHRRAGTAREPYIWDGLWSMSSAICRCRWPWTCPTSEGGHSPGTVYLGWAVEHVHGHLHLQLQGDPDEVLDQTVAAAVHLLLARAQEVRHDAAQPANDS